MSSRAVACELNVHFSTISRLQKRFRESGVSDFGEVFSSRMNPGFHCTGQMADGIMRVSGLLMSKLWIACPMVAVGLWYGQVYVMDNEHRCILMMAFWMHRNTVTMLHVARICTQFLEAENIPVFKWPAYSPDISPIGLYNSVFQVLPISSSFAQPLNGSGPTFDRPQLTWTYK